MKNVIIAIAAAAILASGASATTALYRVDYVIGTDYIASALSNLGYATTTISGDLSAETLSNYDVVVYANQDTNVPFGDLASLNSFIGSGGKVLYTTYSDEAPNLGATESGVQNLNSFTVGSQFSAGITGPLSVVSTGWGTYSLGLTPSAGGTAAGSFDEVNAAIVIGNGGRTVWNGFLSDTVASSQLYQNELSYLVSGGGAVPEPANWVMLITGFGLVGAAARRRRVAVTA
jgi:hypothetical protein